MIFDIQRYSIHDGPGIRTTVFFKGCNLKCKWCHNPESQSHRQELAVYASRCKNCHKCEAVCKNTFTSNCTACGKCVGVCENEAREIIGKKATKQDILDAVMKDVEYYSVSGGGVTLSGGEPLLQAEFALEVLKYLKENGIHMAVETAGNVPTDVIQKVLPFVDLFLFDIKGIDAERHRANTGVRNDVILANAEFLKAHAKAVLFRMPVVPGYNLDEVGAVKAFVGEFPLELLAYHAIGKSKYLATGRGSEIINALTPSVADMEELAKKVGAVYNKTGISN